MSLRIFTLLAFCLTLAHCQATDGATAKSGASPTGPAGTKGPPKAHGEDMSLSEGLTSDQRAALWAGFVGGMVCIFGLGMLFFDMVVRKYTNPYRYSRGVDMHIANYKP